MGGSKIQEAARIASVAEAIRCRATRAGDHTGEGASPHHEKLP